MRTMERLRRMKAFFEEELCEGRELKCPKPSTGQKAEWGPNILDFTMVKPRVFLAWQPARPNEPGKVDSRDPFSVTPSITIMPNAANVRYVEEKRFDRYNKYYRTQDMGQGFAVQILFSVYEPGVRLKGFAGSMESGQPDMSLLMDGTEPGLETLLNWMDDGIELLLREGTIPGTDLTLEDDSFMYALYTDQAYIVDKRPLYQGFLIVPFKGYASPGNEHGRQTRVERLLDGIE